MIHQYAPIGRSLAVAVALGVATLGCTNGGEAGNSSTTSLVAAVERETVAVAVRTIVSATKLTGLVEPVPGVSAVAPASGSLRLTDLRRLAGTQVSAGQQLATVEMACDAPTGEAAASDGTAPTPTTAVCHGQVVSLDAAASGRLTLAAPVDRAVKRGDTTLEVTDGDDVAAIAPEGWQLRLPLGDDDQPARFADAPPLAYALLPDTAEPVFQARFDRLDYSEGGSVAVIAIPMVPPPLVRGARVTVTFVTDRREDVPALPISAVRSTANVGQVLVMVDGDTEAKQVIVGPNDGAWIEVQGLAKDDRVVRYPLKGELGDP